MLEPRRLFAGNVFAPPTQLSTGPNPMGIAAADFNGDGTNDLVVACTEVSAPGFYVHFANGSGGFGAGVRVSSVSAPRGIVTGDFDHDGKADVAIARGALIGTLGSVEVFKGKGDGTFGAGASYAAGLGTSALAVGDLNRDGFQDLIATNTLSGTVSVFSGKAGGLFNAASSTVVGLTPTSTTVADFDEDGKLDLVVTTLTNVRFLSGNGDLSFDPATTAYSFAQSLSLQLVKTSVADINYDGHADLLVPDLTGTVNLLLGKGTGTFETPRRSVPQGLVTGLASLAADLNHDGASDMATIDYSGGKLILSYGATPTTIASETIYNIGANPSAIDLIDVNGDRRLDLVVTNSADATISVLLNTASTTLSTAVDRVLRRLTILGTDGDDTLTIEERGSQYVVTLNGLTSSVPLSDFDYVYVNAGQGNDTVDFSTTTRSVDVSGGYGNDTIYAGSGNDTLFGSMGNDVLDGGPGMDRVGGWKGNDTLFGGEGDDRMYGYTGNDRLDGNSGKDRMWGEDGDDTLHGGQSNDRLYGGAGNDRLIGNIGNDLLSGGDGRDEGDVQAGDIVDSIEVIIQ